MIAGGGVCNRCKEEGFGFYPTDEVLVRRLKRKIRDPDSDHYIVDVKDLSKLEPSDLLRITQKNRDGKEGYFFWWPTYKNNRISRKGKNGYWGETRGCVSIDSGEDGVIAKKRVFVFFKGVYPGTRTAWFIYQFELAVSHPHPIHQDKKEIFLCKLVEHEQKDTLSGSKRKAEHNVQETPAKPRRPRKDGNLRKKAKFSGAQEAQLHDEHNNNNNNNNNIMSCEVLDGSQSLPSDRDSSILTGESTPQSHRLPSKNFSSNNMLARGHYWSTGGLDPSNGFPGDIQNVDDNQQSHHLSSNSINSFSTSVGMQPSQHFHSSTPEEISNIEDPHFDAYEKSQPKLPTPEDGSLDWMDEDKNCHLEGFINIEELLAQLGQPQPPTTAEVHGCNKLPPTTDLSRGADQLQDQSGKNEEDYDRFMSSLPPLS